MDDKQLDSFIHYAGRLRAVRKKLKLNQKEFAVRMGISPSYLSEVETGKTRPGYNFLMAIAREFGVSADYLLHGSGGIFLEKDNPDIVRLEFGEQNTEVREMLHYFKVSPLVRYTVMAYTSKFLLTNAEIVKLDISKSNGKANK